jgi:alanyl-tRNA synthetase
MGATGPCGPCSEIHYDRIGGRDASLFVNADRPDVIEIWNVVFIQFNREADGSLKELPSKHVDTGMGFERLSSILQGKDSNYDTDIFMPIFEAIHANCNCRPYEGLVGADDRELIDMAYRVVADHIRTLTFAITDGAVPSSEGRGYVLRRILRRAVRYGQEILHAPPGFFASLVSVVVDNFKDAFPELETRMKQVKHIIADEEHSFNRTLDQGVKHFGKVVAAMQTRNETVIPAQEAHLLFGSMGFPLDLTELMAAERGLTVDTEGFHALMENDRKISEAAEAARKSGGSKDLTLEAEQTSWLSSNNIAITDSSSKYEWNIAPKVHVVAIFHGRGGSGSGFETKASGSDGTIGLILDQTPFYYESGGQIFDTGRLHTKGCDFVVDSVQTYAGYVVHVGSIHGKDITVGKQLVAHVDYNRRSLIAPNHTMTHVLNFALRKTLLSDLKDDIDSSAGLVEQKGSLVDAEKLRFDFSWNGALTSAQVHEVETTVVKLINSKVNVFAEVVPLAIASKIRGLRQVFGERYPDPVRVISVGADVQRLIAEPDREEWQDVSIEFCGGTHLNNTSEAEDFVLVEESGIAKGIRRIVGLTKIGAREARNRANILLERLTELENMECGAELNNLSKAIKVEVLWLNSSTRGVKIIMSLLFRLIKLWCRWSTKKVCVVSKRQYLRS